MNAPTETTLPDLDDERIATMERTVFARIAEERTSRTTRRRRWWITGSAAAAVLVVAAIIAPALTSSLSPAATSFSTESVALEPVAPDAIMLDEQGADGFTGQSAAGGAEVAQADAAADGAARETVSTASATVVVDDVRAAAEQIGTAADARGGYVESMSVGADGAAAVDSGMIETAPYPGTGDGWVTVRVPADQLTDAIADLDEVGEVTTSTVSAQDVTDQAIDLRARIAAAEASVQRLTELMSQAQSTADLIAAESALQERQAALDADRQQLAFLEGQVALASLSVQLTPATAPPVEADPAGFGDGVAAGWNGLIATLNGIVIALGFLLPWIAVLAVVGGIVWGVVALVGRSRRRPPRAPAED